VHGRSLERRNSRATAANARGYDYTHSAVDDHTRLACSDILPDEQGPTAAAFWRRAQAFFTAHGITGRRVITAIITGPTHHSAANHPPAVSPSSVGRTDN
jgi:hypothetical protein